MAKENMDTKVRKERDNEIIADFRLGTLMKEEKDDLRKQSNNKRHFV